MNDALVGFAIADRRREPAVYASFSIGVNLFAKRDWMC